MTTGTTAAHVITIQPSGKAHLTFRYDGSAYNFYGDTGYIDKFNATSAPGVGDDIADGYGPGSLWLNTTSNLAYVCESNSAGAAVWNVLGGGISDGIPLLGGGGTGTGIGPGMAGLPQSASFSAAGGPAAASQSVTGGRAWGQGTPASGGLGFGGGLIGMAGGAVSGAAGLATSGAAMGMDGGMGGAAASAVAQIGIQEIQRAAGAVGQYAGAAVGGLMETFSLNDSALGDPSRSWLGKIAGAAAGVRPALPNSAGGEGKPMAEAGKEKDQPSGPPGPLTPEQADATKAADAEKNGGGGGTTNTVNNNVNVTNQGASEDYTGQTIQAHLGAQAMAGQPR